MRNRGTRALYEYWQSAKGSQEVPSRTNIEPRGLKEVLPWVFILEHVDRELSPFRLAGTGLCDQYGQELRGTNFLSLWLGDCRRTMRSLIDNVVLMPAGAFIEFEAQSRLHGRTSGEIVLLPLCDANGDVHQVLGGWFPAITQDITMDKPLVRHRITNIRILSELNTPFTETVPGMDGERPHLQLVISDGKSVRRS